MRSRRGIHREKAAKDEEKGNAYDIGTIRTVINLFKYFQVKEEEHTL